MRALAGLLVFATACAARPAAPTARARTARTNATEAKASTSEAGCVSCHPSEVEEWRGSMHRASFTSADFQRSFRAEPREFCADCHAPLRTARGRRDEASGIGCLACHAPAEGHTAGEHAAVATTSCAPCHDFDVPGSGAVLQSTSREHEASAFAGTSCVECHMSPRAAGRRDHRFRSSRDTSVLARVLRVDSADIDPEGHTVIVRLAANRVGHRFPTGDIYRRLTVTLTASDENGAVLGGETFHLSRDWDRHRASLRRRDPEPIAEDTRLGDDPRELRVSCSRPPARVHLTVDYERGAGADGDFFESFETLEILDQDVPIGPRR